MRVNTTSDPRPTTSRLPSARRIARGALGLLIGLIALLLFGLVVLAPFTTAIPIGVGLLLIVADGLVLILALRKMPTFAAKALTLIGGFAVVVASAIALSQVWATTPPIRGPDGNLLPGSIAALEEVELNGSRQWVTIRGQDRTNPVLLFLAGGPGGSELPSTRLHLGLLEEHFVVVNWDQPGAGKSYGAVDIDTLTPKRYLADAHALIEHLRARFEADKIYLMGESWGTILGIWLVRDYPDLFRAYVGSGQMVNTTENDRMGYELALRYLSEQGRSDRLRQLRQSGPPPYTEGNLIFTYAAYLDVLNHYMAQRAPGEGENHDILIDAIFAPEYGLWDKVNWVRGLIEVFNAVYPQLADLDLTQQAAELDVPVYFFVGRHDVNAMTSLVERYYAELKAPHKELVWFEKSGHTPLYEEPDKWVKTMVSRVLNRFTMKPTRSPIIFRNGQAREMHYGTSVLLLARNRSSTTTAARYGLPGSKPPKYSATEQKTVRRRESVLRPCTVLRDSSSTM